MLISYLQVLSAVYGSFKSVQWPQNFRDFIGSFQFLTFNPIGVVMPACLNRNLRLDAFDDFVVAVVLLPSLLLAVSVLPSLFWHWRGGHSPKLIKAAAVRNMGFVVFLLYPYCATSIFRLLRPCSSICYDLEERDCIRYLDTDYSIQCSGDKYEAYKSAAWAFVALYVIGIPLVLTILLLRGKRRGHVSNKKKKKERKKKRKKKIEDRNGKEKEKRKRNRWTDEGRRAECNYKRETQKDEEVHNGKNEILMNCPFFHFFFFFFFLFFI